jgi:hypothetical protein
MLSRLLAAAAIVCTTATTETVIDAPAGALQFVVRVDAERFLAFNPSARPELIEFTSDLRGTRAVVVLAPFEDVEYDFAPGAIDGIQFEVFADDHDVVVRSGRWSLTKLRDSASGGAWIENGLGHAHTWAYQGAAWQGLDASDLGASGGPHALCAPPLSPPPPAPHVPVIMPEDSQHGDMPPRLESKPLPPV